MAGRNRTFTILSAIAVAACLTAFCNRAAADAPVDGDLSEVTAQYNPGPMLQRFLDGPMSEVDEIVFAVRVPGRDHWYVTFGNYADHSQTPAKDKSFKFEEGVYWGYAEGGRLCSKNLRTGELRTLLDDPKGGVRDPQMHYDGRKVLFSYRPGGSHTFHLYEINVDGTGLTQLTDGPDDDIEPTYCPDGSIVFCSSRCRRFVNCWFTRVAALYRCDGDGSGVRMISSNNDHDNTPWVLPDGRILYMRWEYVDRSQVHFHHLWTMNPDGTNQVAYFGNMHGGIAMLDAKPIPGTKKVVASFSPGHGRPEHLGYVSIVDPSLGPDMKTSARNVSKQSHWKDPYAFSEECFLVVNRQGISVMDGQGNTELIHQLPEDERNRFECHEPRPMGPRPRERVIPTRTNLASPTARLILEDIYHGRNMPGVEPGEITKLLVLQQLAKPVNFSGGMQPLTIGGTFTLAQIVGTVPVEPDGSAYIEVPALRSLFLVALDKNDVPVKRMHSFMILQPGETTSCIGCHEQRIRAPHAVSSDLMALRGDPHPVTPIEDVPPVLDFPRDIQPILDKHCVECHNPDRREGRVDLCGDRTAMYSIAYWTMQTRQLVSDGRNQPHGNRPPRSYGSAVSRLMTLIDGSHFDAKLSEHETRVVRLWIETSATYPGTYASLGCGHYPVHLTAMPALVDRCGKCHVRHIDDKYGKRTVVHFPQGAWGGSLEPYCNLTRPEKSYILRAPLAKDAGGLGICEEAVFQSTDDPLYKGVLASIRNAHDRLEQGKRFDMQGFRPNEHYIREMQRFGFLPKDLKPEDPIDVYAVDRAYWDSFDYQPVGR